MKHARSDFSTKYQAVLRTHVGENLPFASDRAQGLGRAALTCALLTRDLAIVHEKALVALAAVHEFDPNNSGPFKRAGHFFTQALIPLEAAEQATRTTNRLLRQRNSTLRLQTAALARGYRRLQREITRRRAGEVIIRKGKDQYQKLFAESQIMQAK